MDLKDAAAVVTGGASGLGEATARRLKAAGAHVTIIDFNADKGEALAKELGVKFVKADVTDAEQVAEAVVVAAEDGPLRVGVNCAGTGTAVRTISKDGSPHIRKEWDRVVGINLVGTFLCMTHEASQISKSEPLADGQRGVIINTASVAAFDGQIGQLAYSASKGGVVAMTLPAARDLSVAGIRVCTIAPGLMDTPLLGMLPGRGQVGPRRVGRVPEAARAARRVRQDGAGHRRQRLHERRGHPARRRHPHAAEVRRRLFGAGSLWRQLQPAGPRRGAGGGRRHPVGHRLEPARHQAAREAQVVPGVGGAAHQERRARRAPRSRATPA